MANPNDYYSGYDDDYQDEFSQDDEFDSPRRGLKMPKLGKGSGGTGSGSGSGLINTITSVAAAVLSLLCLLNVAGVKSSTSKQYDMISAELQAVKQANSEILAHLAAIEAGLDSTQSAIASGSASKYIQITKQPSSTPTTMGRDAALIFSIEAEGSNLTMTWQKYDQVSGSWINVVFDGKGYNTDMGLRLYDDSANGKSELWAMGLTEKAFGSYRCSITDRAGTPVNSDVVELSERVA